MQGDRRAHWRRRGDGHRVRIRGGHRRSRGVVNEAMVEPQPPVGVRDAADSESELVELARAGDPVARESLGGLACVGQTPDGKARDHRAARLSRPGIRRHRTGAGHPDRNGHVSTTWSPPPAARPARRRRASCLTHADERSTRRSCPAISTRHSRGRGIWGRLALGQRVP